MDPKAYKRTMLGVILYFVVHFIWVSVEQIFLSCKSIDSYRKAYMQSQVALKERASRYNLKASDYILKKHDFVNNEKWYFLYWNSSIGDEPIVVYPNCEIDSI